MPATIGKTATFGEFRSAIQRNKDLSDELAVAYQGDPSRSPSEVRSDIEAVTAKIAAVYSGGTAMATSGGMSVGVSDKPLTGKSVSVGVGKQTSVLKDIGFLEKELDTVPYHDKIRKNQIRMQLDDKLNQFYEMQTVPSFPKTAEQLAYAEKGKGLKPGTDEYKKWKESNPEKIMTMGPDGNMREETWGDYDKRIYAQKAEQFGPEAASYSGEELRAPVYNYEGKYVKQKQYAALQKDYADKALAAAAFPDDLGGKVYTEDQIKGRESARQLFDMVKTPAGGFLDSGLNFLLPRNPAPEQLGPIIGADPAAVSRGLTPTIDLGVPAGDFSRAVYPYSESDVKQEYKSGLGTPDIGLSEREIALGDISNTADNLAEFLAPAPLDKGVYSCIQRVALEAHKALGCEHFSRVDIRLSRDNTPFVLEVNSIPGLTSHSLLPLSARCYGIDFDGLIKKMVVLALERGRIKVNQ